MNDFLWLLLALPLAGSAACGILHGLTLRARRADASATGPSALAPVAAVGAMAGAFVVALVGLFQLVGHDAHHRVLESSPWRWIDLGLEAGIDVSLVLDPLSSILVLVITGVGLLIHVYSAGYMKGDPGYAKYFAYLNLFVAAMLLLVLSSNLMGLFIGWEGVGLCSYLLIGFWYEKGWPAEAGQKAFVMNRIGDACFLIGSFLLFRVFATLDLSEVASGAAHLDPSQTGTLAFAALCLFGGCCGKSAQWPLFTWLPDAMAGPTPVSALIHAATMVTAGVYLVVRLNPVFAASGVLFVVAIVGALTAFIGATSALFQKDIKKVLAYSTVSQLGYMFLGLGVGAFGAAVFHLVTHAFFKGLLFLGSGSVIHAMHEEQDMTKMGGLRKHMPTTFWTFWAGALALSGFPLLAGFWSKDEILAHTFLAGWGFRPLWLLGVITAALTAFYTFRMVALTFHGDERFDPDEVHPHESPKSMTVPLMVLAVLAGIGGVLGLPHVLHVPHVLNGWLEPVLHDGHQVLHGHAHHHLAATTEWLLLGLGAAVALGFCHLGFHSSTRGPVFDREQEERRGDLVRFLRGAWNIDRSYLRGVVQPLKMFAFLVATLVDQFVIDGAVNGVAALARGAADKSRKLVDGSVKTYALWMGSGAAALALVWLLATRLG